VRIDRALQGKPERLFLWFRHTQIIAPSPAQKHETATGGVSIQAGADRALQGKFEAITNSYTANASGDFQKGKKKGDQIGLAALLPLIGQQASTERVRASKI